MNTIAGTKRLWAGVGASGVLVFFAGKAYGRYSADVMHEKTEEYLDASPTPALHNTDHATAYHRAAADTATLESADPRRMRGLLTAGGVIAAAATAAYFANRGHGALPNQLMHMRIFMQASAITGLGAIAAYENIYKPAQEKKLSVDSVAP